jgi:hypothetical protein
LGRKPCEVMLKKLEERMLQCLEMKAEDFGHMMSFVQHPAERVFAGGGTHGHLEQQQEAAFLSMDVNAPDVATRRRILPTHCGRLQLWVGRRGRRC